MADQKEKAALVDRLVRAGQMKQKFELLQAEAEKLGIDLSKLERPWEKEIETIKAEVLAMFDPIGVVLSMEPEDIFYNIQKRIVAKKVNPEMLEWFGSAFAAPAKRTSWKSFGGELRPRL